MLCLPWCFKLPNEYGRGSLLGLPITTAGRRGGQQSARLLACVILAGFTKIVEERSRGAVIQLIPDGHQHGGIILNGAHRGQRCENCESGNPRA